MCAQQLPAAAPDAAQVESAPAVRHRYAVTCGGLVRDTTLVPLASQFTDDSKCDCRRRRSLGGGAWNAADQLKRLGANVWLLGLVGDDDEGRRIRSSLFHEFPQALILPILDETRETFIINGVCHTLRSSIANGLAKLPPAAVELIAGADLVTVAPSTPADNTFVEELLGLSRVGFRQNALAITICGNFP